MSAFITYQSRDILERLYEADRLRFEGSSFSELPPITEIRRKQRYTVPIFVECSRVISKDDTVIEVRHILNPLIFPARAAAREIERLRALIKELEGSR